GFDLTPGTLNWETFVTRRQAYIDGIHESYRRRIEKAGIERIAAKGRFVAAHVVEADDRRLQAPHVVIANGARSRKLDLQGFELGIDSDGFFDLTACPKRAAIGGGGYIAVELGGVLNALGAEVDIMARHRLLSGFDDDLSRTLGEWMRSDGIGIHYHCNVQGVRRKDGGLHLDCDSGSGSGA